jgi:radical SAM protein with 4Fe4S-binding SPASM domain
MMHSNQNTRPELPADTFHKEVNSYHILTHPDRPSWIVVNDFGWEILKLCNGKNSVQDILNSVKSRYSVSEDILARDLEQFMCSIDKSGFLSIVGGSTPATPRITSVFLHLTDKCNLHCKHCYAQNMSARGAELSDRELTSFLEKFYAAGGRAVVISGGEPLLRKNFKDLFAINPSADFILLTNATLIDAECARFLSQFNISIQVSIDGSSAEVHDPIRGKGSFTAAMAGLEQLKKHGLQKHINFCTTIMQQNLTDLPNILTLARDSGISFVRFLPLRKKGNARANWDKIHSGVTTKDYERFFAYILRDAIYQYSDIDIRCGLTGYILDSRKLMNDRCWCPIGTNMVVDTMGNIYPCSLFMEDQFKLGNVKDTKIEDIQANPLLNELVMARSTRKTTIERCRSCMWRNFCQSSCMGVALEQHGTIWETDEFCTFRITLYEQSVIKLAEGKISHRQLTVTDTPSECY